MILPIYVYFIYFNYAIQQIHVPFHNFHHRGRINVVSTHISDVSLRLMFGRLYSQVSLAYEVLTSPLSWETAARVTW